MNSVHTTGRGHPPWRSLVVMLLLAGAYSGVTAEDVSKRLRLSVSFGAYESQDEISNDSANVLTVLDAEGEIDHKFTDPRDDAAAAGDLKIQGGLIGTLALQYAVNRTFILEASAGYNENDVGDVEIQKVMKIAPLPGQTQARYESEVVRFSAGRLTRVPLQLTGLVRFRPDKNFNPYVGGGFGYTLIGFDPSDDLDRLSLNLDESRARQAILKPDTLNNDLDTRTGEPGEQLGAVTVETDDPWEWHVVGGFELAVARRWAFFLDLRYSEASTDFRIRYSGRDNIGVSVPQGKTQVGSELATDTYGPWTLLPGGLLDVDGDGQVDPGQYYVQGGTLEFDGLTAQLGIRYTF